MMNAQKILRKYKDMKILPHVAIHLSRLISNESSPIQEFEKVIKMDPILVLRLLKLINSPYYGLRNKVDSISRVIVLLGMNNLRNMVVTAALKEIFKSDLNNGSFSKPALWLHCATVSICSQMISERIFGKKGEDAFLCGILHDVGMIIEDQVAHELFLQTCREYNPKTKQFPEYEQEIIGTDHCELGYLLSCDWKLPVEVQDGIRYHHKLNKKIDPSSITAIVQYADYIVSKMNYPSIPGWTPALSPDLVDFLKKNIGEFKALTRDLPSEIEKAKEIYEQKEE